VDVNEIEVGKVCLTDAPLKTHFTRYKLHDSLYFWPFRLVWWVICSQNGWNYDHAIFTI